MIVVSTEAQENADLVMKAVEVVFDNHDFTGLDHFFSEVFVQHSPYAPPGGLKELKAWLQRMVDAMPDVRGTIEQVIAARDRVVLFRTLRGTVVGDLPDFGILAANQALEFQVAHMFQVANGKITAHWEIMESGPATRLAFQSMR